MTSKLHVKGIQPIDCFAVSYDFSTDPELSPVLATATPTSSASICRIGPVYCVRENRRHIQSDQAMVNCGNIPNSWR